MKKAGSRAGKTSHKKADSKASAGQSSSLSFNVVCIGASAGGLNAIMELISQLPASLNAAVFVVLHFSKGALGQILVDRIKRDSQLHCSIAKDNEQVKPGHVYLAPPDVHLLIKDKIILAHGPAENRFRPSIDVLFKSAAAHYGENVVGVVLTGLLNDGTSGMWAIKESGGQCIVQDPDEAEYPDMPLSVLQSVEVDYILPLKKIGPVIGKIVKGKKKNGAKPPSIIIAESRLSEKTSTTIDKLKEIGEKSSFACPDCGGGLYKIRNGRSVHYKCHVGHSYSQEDLLVEQSSKIENTLWVAVRMMEERKLFFTRLANENRDRGLQKLSDNYHRLAGQLDIHIEKMKELLFAIQKE
jgi:two-component system chemotaxis response regulator CheB